MTSGKNYQVEHRMFGRVVHSPTIKVFAVFTFVTFWLICLALTPILVPMHFILRKCGRNGFYFDHQLVIGKRSLEYSYWPYSPM